ncbi:unnamed protein product, partial [Mesorhabditis spiculigera]
MLQPIYAFLGANSQNQGNYGKKKGRTDCYKTVMCQSWLETRICLFNENCRFAHGEEELRPAAVLPKSVNKYKTKLCDKYTTTGVCPYGKRCLFIHPEAENGDIDAYIRPDKQAEIANRHAEANYATQIHGVPQPKPGKQSYMQKLRAPSGNQQTPLRAGDGRYGTTTSRGLRPHPSWPIDQKLKERAGSPPSLLDMVFDNSFPLKTEPAFDYIGRTPSPDQWARSRVLKSTPSSGYVSGNSTPAEQQLFDFPTVGFSHYSGGLCNTIGSTHSSMSSVNSISGDGFDLEDISGVNIDFDFLHDSSFIEDDGFLEKSLATPKKHLMSAHQLCTIPFSPSDLLR